MFWTKGNQETLYKDLIDYFDDDSFKKQIIDDGNYKKIIEKAHAQIKIREYYQTNDSKWLSNRSKWKSLKSIGIVEKL